MPTSLPQSQEDYFTPHAKRASTLPAPYTNGTLPRHSSAPLPRPGNFHRRPTNMSEKAVRKGGADSIAHLEDEKKGHINLEHGLDICINCEVNPKDPAGITVPYRLLVPALWYEGPEDVNRTPYRKKGVLERFKSIKLGRGRKSGLAKRQGQGEWGGTDSDYTPSISEVGEAHQPQHQQQPRPVISNPMPLQGKGYPGRRSSKADRMLGTTTDDYHPPSANGNGNGNGSAGAKRVSTAERLFGSSTTDDHHHPPNNGNGTAGAKRVSTTERLFGSSATDDHPPIRNGGVKARLDPFPPRPQPNEPSSPPTATTNNSNNNGGGIVLGPGAKTSSAGSRATGPQGLPTGNGTVKMGMGEKVRSATGSIMRSGSKGYQAPDAGNEGVVLGRGEKVRSAGRGGVRYADDDGYGDEDGNYSEGSYSGSDGYEGGVAGRGQAPVSSAGDGKGKGYGGIEAYKEKSWRRFF